MYGKYGKRWLDLIVSVPLAVFLAPILGLVALIVRTTSPGPVFFVQDRLGRHAQVFRVFKFRTMTDRQRIPDREIFGQNAEVTRVGYWLRRFKLDELPQVFNVVKGDMSLVGPRPALPSQLAEYDDVALTRLDVRPGLTGLSQVNGNIYLSWPERWQYDALYVKDLSLWLDLRIILRTIAVVILGERKFYQRPDTGVDLRL